MDNTNSLNPNNYDLISQICLKNASLKQAFKQQKNIMIEKSSEIKAWLEIIGSVNLELTQKIGKIEVLLKWYKIMTSKQGYSQAQIEDTEKQISSILMELINTDLEKFELDDGAEEDGINSNFSFNENEDDEEFSPNINVDGKINFDFNFNFNFAQDEEEITIDTREINQAIEPENNEVQTMTLDLDFLPYREETEEITTEIKELNLDFIPLEATEIETEIKEKINFATASRAQLIEETRNEEDQETVNLFDEPLPLEAAEENVRIFGENEPITLEELQIVFNRISKLSMRYLGATLTKNYFQSTQGNDSLSQQFQMNTKGQITVSGNSNQEITPQELITFKQWTSHFIQNCSTIISNFPVMIKKQNLLGRIS